MRILLTFLVIAGVATANTLRGANDNPESRELQTFINSGGSYGRGRGRGRNTGTALFIVEDDNDRSTTRCADDTADEFEDDFDDIYIVDNDDDARNGDVVAVIDGDTDCDRLWDDIYEEVDQQDQHTATTVYVYYGSGSRYYRNRARSKQGYRLYYGRYGRNRNKSRKYWGGGSGRNRYWNRYHDHDGGDWHHDNDDNEGGWHHEHTDEPQDENIIDGDE